MAFGHGNDMDLRVADSGGTSRNFTSFITNISPSFDADANESTTAGNRGRRYVRGLNNATLDVSGIYDTGGTATPDQWLNGLGTASASAVVYFPNGSASGKPYYSGSALLTNYSIDSPVDDVVTWSASFQFDGTPARGTV